MIFVILALCLLLIARGGPLGIMILGIVWICAWAFNPNIDSGLVWLLGFSLGFIPNFDWD